MQGSCLRHHFSGFVWQQEARPLHILGTSKPGKSRHPSPVLPRSNSAPTCLTVSFPGEKFPPALPEIAAQIGPLLQGGWAPCPSQSPDGNLPPTPRRRAAVPGCLQRLVQRRHSRMPQSCGEAQAAARRSSDDECRAALRSSRNAAPGAQQPTTLRQGEGRRCRQAPEALRWALCCERRKRHTHTKPCAPISRDPREPSQQTAPECRPRYKRLNFAHAPPGLPATPYTCSWSFCIPACHRPHLPHLRCPHPSLEGQAGGAAGNSPDCAVAVTAEEAGHGTGSLGALLCQHCAGQALPGSARSLAALQRRQTPQYAAQHSTAAGFRRGSAQPPHVPGAAGATARSPAGSRPRAASRAAHTAPPAPLTAEAPRRSPFPGPGGRAARRTVTPTTQQGRKRVIAEPPLKATPGGEDTA